MKNDFLKYKLKVKEQHEIENEQLSSKKLFGRNQQLLSLG